MCRWTWYPTWIHQLFHPHHYVCLLPVVGHGSQGAEIFVVEKIHHHFANRKYIPLVQCADVSSKSASLLPSPIFRFNFWSSSSTHSKFNSNPAATSPSQSLPCWPSMRVSSHTCSVLSMSKTTTRNRRGHPSRRKQMQPLPQHSNRTKDISKLACLHILFRDFAMLWCRRVPFEPRVATIYLYFRPHHHLCFLWALS